MTGTAYREAHPLPYVLTHWAHLLAMLALGFTGFFIHYPFLPVRMAVMREVHLTAAYVVLIVLAVRLWYGFAGRSAVRKGERHTERDVHNFLPQPENRGKLTETARYYLFMRDTHPPTAKYNPLQKAAYLTMSGLLLLQAYTGLALYGPVQGSAVGFLFGFGTEVLGGLTGIRLLHYLVTWAFVALVAVHVYLSVAEDAVSLPLMFFWRETVPAAPPAPVSTLPSAPPVAQSPPETPRSAIDEAHEQLTLDLPSDAS